MSRVGGVEEGGVWAGEGDGGQGAEEGQGGQLVLGGKLLDVGDETAESGAVHLRRV
jgi:hypothetical protein